MADANVNMNSRLADLGLGADMLSVERPMQVHRSPGWRLRNDIIDDTVRFVILFLVDVVSIITAAGAVVIGTQLAVYAGLEASWQTVGQQKLLAAESDFGFVALAVLAYMLCQGRYRARMSFGTEMRQVAVISCGALFVSCLEQFAVRGHASRQLLIGTWLLFPAVAALLRLAAKIALNKAGLWQTNVLVFGEASGASYARAKLSAEPLLGYRVVGAMTSPQVRQQAGMGVSANRFRRLLEMHGARHLIMAIDFGSHSGQELLQEVVRERVPFSLMFQAHGIPVSGYELTSFFSDNTVILSHRNNLHHPIAKFIKAAFDIQLATLLLALCAMPMLIIACIIRLDGGPALFSHERVGAGGRVFRCLKFRTMVPNAQAVLADLLARDPQASAEWASTHKLVRDPRVTAIGRFLRATSLDELPQLINIVRLEMSLVGPRPIVSEEVTRYGENIVYYYETRPGLTGLWQVSGRSDTTYERRIELDRWYVHNWTLWHDIAILLKTVPAVILRQGAR